MFFEPMHCSRRGHYRSTDGQSQRASSQTTNQHSPGRTCASLDLVALIEACSFELAFSIHVGAAAQVSVNQRRVQKIALAIREDHGFRQNPNARLARDAPRVT